MTKIAVAAWSGPVPWVASLALCLACSGSGGDSGNHVVSDSGSGASGNGGSGAGGASGNGGTLGSGGKTTGGASGGGGVGGVGASCRADADCSPNRSLYCAPEGANPGCGICPSPTQFPSCSTDADCNPSGGSQICVGACFGACPSKSCVAGCATDASCKEGEHCSATSHRCEATSCAAATDCPSNFDCKSSSCGRRACKADAECSGYCVTGFCYGKLGQCQQPRA